MTTVQELKDIVVAADVSMQDLADWYTAQAELSKWKEKEIDLRNKIYKGIFVTKNEDDVLMYPKEGTNTFDINDGTGHVLKASRVINRGVDEAMVFILKKERQDLADKGDERTSQEEERFQFLCRLKLSDLIRYKPEVSIKEYRMLTEEERLVFDTCLIIKDGTPQMEIVKPKRK